ncbi:hypothetical protein H5J24_17935 [Chryseobacterium capnotolerans]|uniref:hypothetical protein n=1 Tax=Chryseobacterium TaxID=59732 RepID=UPI00083B0D28|nr:MULTISPECIES: hypothetical protein [Chryseobacterium]UHO37545.1 hypothetical protein H5J24_17935 [Chryseobacterium capnotolerans]
MKKIFLYILAGSLCLTACKKDDEVETYKEPEDINVQNTYDDQAITKFLDDNYLDAQGNIKAFSATDTSDDNEKKLSQLKVEKLPSGTIYIMRDGAQPAADNGKVIATDDIIKIMGRVYTYLAIDNNGTTVFSAKTQFLNTIDDTTIPFVDPAYYYAKKSVREANKQERPYFEISGFREALQKFTAFKDIPNSTPYNLQGVIIVPSRAAFARNPHYPYLGTSYRNKSFVFNFQIYGTETRTTDK